MGAFLDWADSTGFHLDAALSMNSNPNAAERTIQRSGAAALVLGFLFASRGVEFFNLFFFTLGIILSTGGGICPQ